MFLVRSSAPANPTIVGTASAPSALAHVQSMARQGMAPTVTTFSGRTLSLADLRKLLPGHHRRQPLAS